MGAQASTSANDHGAGEGERAFSNAGGAEAQATTSATGATASQGRFRIGGMCLDPKVIAGLAVVGLGVWALAPGFVWAILPVLLLAACPLSMVLMMRGMQGNQGAQSGQCASHATDQARLGSPSGSVATTSVESLASLKGQLSNIQAQQEAITGEIARLEQLEASPLPPVALAPPAQSQAVSTPRAPIRG